MTSLPLLFVLMIASPDQSDCPTGRRVDLSLDAWRKDLVRSNPNSYDLLLGKVKLRPVHGADYKSAKLERVDFFEARMTGSGLSDHVVQAKFTARRSKGEQDLTD